MEAVAARLGVSRSGLSAIEHGTLRPPQKLLDRLAEEGINLHWLLTGEGPKWRGEWAPREISAEELREDWAEVPLVADEIAAGAPSVIRDEDVEEKLLVPRLWVRPSGRYACVRVRGRSMEPVLSPGNIVGVNLRRRDPRELGGQMVALGAEDEGATVKYLRPVGDLIYIEAENRAEWAPRIMGPQDRVIGAVEWAWRKFE